MRSITIWLLIKLQNLLPKLLITRFVNKIARIKYPGQFSTIYLAPFNYHRVHSPIDGRIKRIDHIPGNLFSVNKTTTEFIPEVFAKNERVACYIEKDGVEIIVIFVGALNVGSISTPWTGEIKPKGRGDSTTMAFEKMKSTQIKIY